MSTARILVTLLFAWIAAAAPSFPGLRCSFEDLCAWKWNTSDWVVTGNSGLPSNYTAGPSADASNNSHGHFLFLLVKSPGPKELHVLSPKYVSTEDNCRMELMVHMANMIRGNFKVVVETVNTANTSWVLAEKRGNDNKLWEKHNFNVGRIRQAFNIIIEVTPGGRYPSHIAIDNIKLIDCFKEKRPPDDCRESMFKCSNSHCIDHTSVCDMAVDCADGSDEEQDCDKVSIEGARCNFENGMCEWFNHPDNKMNWTIHSGPTETESTGPSHDHTYRNTTGKYVYVDMSAQQWLGAYAILESPIFNPPPPVISNSSSRLYNSCYVTFYFHHYGHHSGSLTLILTELQTSRVKEVWRSFGDQGNEWHRMVTFLPQITQRYFLRFEGKRSFSDKGDVAIDDFSMSPMCFGIGNFTEEELNGYNYTKAGMIVEPVVELFVHHAFKNKTYYNFTTCGVNGTKGPKPDNCSEAYKQTNINVTVLTEKVFAGIQKWTVPSDGFYTIIAKGAQGGRGAGRTGQSRGAEARLLTELSKGQQLYILVGQAGHNGAYRSMSTSNLTEPKTKLKAALIKLKEIQSLGGGGGGGGASFVFMVTKKGERIPMVIGAGGGGLAYGPFADDGNQHGHAPNKSLKNQTGDAYGDNPAGAGGGWLPGKFTHRDSTGLSLIQGSVGGTACSNNIGNGGFGGGGGGCTAGGGGGGFTGGRAWAEKSRNGEGGYSYIGPEGSMGHTIAGANVGDGQVIIIPAVEGCDCDYLCAALDGERTSTICVCPVGWILSNDTYKCLMLEQATQISSNWQLIITLVATVIFMSLVIVGLFVFLYNRYQQMNATKFRRKIINGPDLQLNRLREASDNMMTEYNPNYEFGGGTYTIRDLKDIPREQLRLVK